LTLIDQAYEIWRRLEPAWGGYLKEAGLDLTLTPKEDFRLALLRKIEVTYTIPGLEDFARNGCRGVEPGDPARSLLYHMLAAPGVTPDAILPKQYPTPQELQVMENLVYGIEPPSLQDLLARAAGQPLAIVVFAYEYAPAADTIQRRHADMCFSRTGIARVGNCGFRYIRAARGFFPYCDEKSHVHVVPCRYGAFIATTRKGNHRTIGPARFQEGDDQRDFWVPLHKLFDGSECIAGIENLRVILTAHHVNEKIRRVHLRLKGGSDGGDPALNKFPFRITEKLAGFSDETDPGLLIPDQHDPLVDIARTPDQKVVTFQVPLKPAVISASLHFPAQVEIRNAPELVHAKHGVVDGEVAYLPEVVPVIASHVAAGGYEAVNFVDYTAEGWIKAKCPALSAYFPRQLAAYSLVAQPDFFPLVKQSDLMEWWEKSAPSEIKDNIWPDGLGQPLPLSDTRVPVNFMLQDAKFDSRDQTMTAIIGMDREPGSSGRVRPFVVRRQSTLSYRSTGLFEPGYDTAQDFDHDGNSPQGVMHLAHYGLGSPFPEDTLLCAAAGAFWPGAVPDVTRFYARGHHRYPTVTPIPDSDTAWADLHLPQLESGSVPLQSRALGDWVRLTFEKKLEYGKFADETLESYIGKTLALSRAFQVLGEDTSDKRGAWTVLSFTAARSSDLERCVPAKSLTAFRREVTYKLTLVKLDVPAVPANIVGGSPTTELEQFFASPGAVARLNHSKGLWDVREF
jgi:hypothetical protein